MNWNKEQTSSPTPSSSLVSWPPTAAQQLFRNRFTVTWRWSTEEDAPFIHQTSWRGCPLARLLTRDHARSRLQPPPFLRQETQNSSAQQQAAFGHQHGFKQLFKYVFHLFFTTCDSVSGVYVCSELKVGDINAVIPYICFFIGVQHQLGLHKMA